MLGIGYWVLGVGSGHQHLMPNTQHPTSYFFVVLGFDFVPPGVFGVGALMVAVAT